MERVAVIPVEYDEKNKEEALKIQEILEKNALLFHCLFAGIEKITFLEPGNTNSVKISNLEELKQITSHSIPGHIALIRSQIMMNSDEPMGMTFLQTMILDKIDGFKNYNSEMTSGESKESFVNLIYSLVAMHYYFNQGTPEKIVDFVYHLPKEEKKKIYTWLNNKHRYDLFNHLLDEQYKILIQENEDYEVHDKFLAQNLAKVIELSQESYIDRKLFMSQDKQNIDIPKLSKDEFDRLCREFLLAIDPSLKWLKIYNKLHKENKVIYSTQTLTEESSWKCIEKEDGDYYILAPLQEDIRDFRNFMHEFTHYISLTNSNDVDYLQPSVKEIPSLFIEMYISQFFKEKGYSEDIIDYLLKEREEWTKNNIHAMETPLRYLYEKLNNGPITEETEKQRLKELNDNIHEGLPEDVKIILNKATSPDNEENIHRVVEVETLNLLDEPTRVAASYPYVVGQYLAKKAFDKVLEDPSVKYTILEITENLSRETVETIVNKLDLDTKFSFSEGSISINNQKIKQTKPDQ